MTKEEKFRKLSIAHGIVGGQGKTLEESLDWLFEEAEVKIEFGRLGDTIARAHWTGTDFRGDTTGGCVSVYKPK